MSLRLECVCDGSLTRTDVSGQARRSDELFHCLPLQSVANVLSAAVGSLFTDNIEALRTQFLSLRCQWRHKDGAELSRNLHFVYLSVANARRTKQK